MQIRNGLVCKHFPELDRLWGQSAQENLAIVRWCLDPRQIAQMPFEEFVLKVTTCDRGLRQRQRLRAIYDVAPESIGIAMGSADRAPGPFVSRPAAFKARAAEKGYGTHRKDLPGLYVLPSVVDDPWLWPLYRGPGTGPHWRAGCGLRRRKQVLCLAGMDLSAKRSGKRSKDVVPVLSKKGNTELRYALYQAAHTASCRNDTIRELFTRYLTGREKEPRHQKKDAGKAGG